MFVREFNACDARAARAARADLMRYLEREGDSVPAGVVETIITELLANVCRHGGGWARASVQWRSDGAAQLTVGDRGPGFDMTLWQRPPELSEHGWGLLIASRLALDFEVQRERNGRGSQVEAVLPVHRHRAA